MAVFYARSGQAAYGYTIGILCAEWHIPFIPGDLNNASTFEFPVRYLPVPGMPGAAVLAGNDGGFAENLVACARQLEHEGVRAITGNCGFLAGYQEAVAGSVNVPVFLSSLLQAPMLAALLGGNRKLGVLVADESGITDRLLAGAGIRDPGRIVFAGLDHQEHWNEVILKQTGMLDEARLRAEVTNGARDLTARDPAIGAFLLECSDLPPYSAAVHAATGLPVFDWAGFVRYVHDAVVPRSYHGTF